MTVREIYNDVLVELNKENSQSFTIEEFNYVLNKSILAFVNEKYNFFGANQQLSDDLRVLLKSQQFSVDDTTDLDAPEVIPLFNPTSAYITADVDDADEITVTSARDLTAGDIIKFTESGTEYEISTIVGNVITMTTNVTVSKGTNILLETTPVSFVDDDVTNERTLEISFVASDYFHIDSCTVLWKTTRPNTGEITHIKFPVRRLTNDMLNAIQNNTYMQPAPNRPYYQMSNVPGNSGGQIMSDSYRALQNKPKVKIYLGNKTSVMELVKVSVDYIKLPETVTLTDENIFTFATDDSQIIELPDYLRNEIVKRCTIYLLEKASDPRVQTQPAFNTEIPSMPISMQLAGLKQSQNIQQNQNQQ